MHTLYLYSLIPTPTFVFYYIVVPEFQNCKDLKAAHLMVASLFGSLAHVTCKVMPLNIFILLLIF